MVAHVHVLIDQSVDDFVEHYSRSPFKSLGVSLKISSARIQTDRIPVSHCQHEVVSKHDCYIAHRNAFRRFGIRNCLQHNTRLVVIDIQLRSLTARESVFNGKVGHSEPNAVWRNFTWSWINKSDPSEPFP